MKEFFSEEFADKLFITIFNTIAILSFVMIAIMGVKGLMWLLLN